MPPPSTARTVAPAEPLLTLRFEGRPDPVFTKWHFAHPNAHNALGAPRRPIKVERSDLLPLREGKLALISFLLLGKLWWVLDGNSVEFFWDGRANTPANSLYDTLHGSKKGWVDAWFGYAPPGGPDGSTINVVRRLAGLLIAPSRLKNRTAKGKHFYQYKSTVITNPSRYAFDATTAPYTPLRLTDVSIEWGPDSDESITDPDMLLNLALAMLAQGSWTIGQRQHLASRLGLPDSLRRWLDKTPRQTHRTTTTPAPVVSSPDTKRPKARVSVSQMTEIRATTEHARLVVRLRAFNDIKDVSMAEKLELMQALEDALGLHEVAGDEAGSLWLTLLLSRSQAEMLANLINAGHFDRFDIGEVSFESSTEAVPEEPPPPYLPPWPRIARRLPRGIPRRERSRRPRQWPYGVSSANCYGLGRGIAAHIGHRFDARFNDLAEQIGRGLERVFWRARNDRLEADEIVQETAVRFMRALDNYPHSIDDIPRYLMRLGNMVTLDLWRRESRWDRRLSPGRIPLSQNLVDSIQDRPDTRAIHGESVSVLWRAIERLEVPERDVLLRNMRGAGDEAIAAELGMSLAKTRTHYQKALISLKSILDAMSVGFEDFSFIHPPPFPWRGEDT